MPSRSVCRLEKPSSSCGRFTLRTPSTSSPTRSGTEMDSRASGSTPWKRSSVTRPRSTTFSPLVATQPAIPSSRRWPRPRWTSVGRPTDARNRSSSPSMSMIDEAPAPIRRATSAAARAITASSCAADVAATTSSASKGISRRSAQSTAGPFQVSIGATTAKAASSPHRPDGTDTANAPPAARANASSPRMACQSAASIRREKTVEGGSAVATTTATASARSSQARCSSRFGHRAVELTVGLLAPVCRSVCGTTLACSPNVSIEPETMEELLATETARLSLRPLRVGETVEGAIAAVAGDEATVDLGDRPAGVIPLREAGSEPLKVGERVIAVVMQPEGPDGRVVLSLRRARNRKQWSQMEELQKSGDLIDAGVLEANRGGVVVDVGLRGFVPLSQLVSIGAIDTREPGVPEPVKALVGKRLQVRVLEADPTRDRLILSEKAATQKLRRDRKAHGTAQLAVGDVRDGIVVGVTSYGLFVDVGLADGLVHRSEITWDKGVEPTSLHRLGDAVKVRVVGIDRDRQRISLSIKRLGVDPWERYVDQLETGQTVDATVTRVMTYGAFARIAEGVEGLIHVSEIAAERVADPSEAVRVGDVLPVRIVAIDRERRRLSLSARLA